MSERTAVERFVGVFSPRRAALMTHARRMSEDDNYRDAAHLAWRARGYASAKASTNKTPWTNSSGLSADGELAGDVGTMRNHSRALERDEPVSSGILRDFRRAVIGTGLRAQSRAKRPGPVQAERVRSAIEAVLAECLARSAAMQGLTDGAQQAVEYEGTLESGDVLLRAATTGPGEPLWIEVVEADRVATPIDAKPADRLGRIVNGVEKDRHGRPVAYWVAKRHPGDWMPANSVLGADVRMGVSLSVSDYERVDVGPDPLRPLAVLVKSRVTRAGQSRGVGLLHAVLDDLNDLGLLMKASLRRAQIATCVAAFISSAADDLDLLQMTAEDYGYQLDQKLTPGLIWRLFPGETVTFSNPSTNAPDLSKFAFLFAQRIGAAIGRSPQTVLKAWEGVSYSAARTIKIDDKQADRVERANYAEQAMAWKARVLLEDALLRGDQRLVEVGATAEDFALLDWIGDEEQWVDPQAEAAAIKEQLTIGLTSLQIECARLGRDWQDVMRQRLEAEQFERDERKRLNLPKQTLPGAAPQAGAAPLQVLDGGKPDETDDDDEAEDDADMPAKEAA